MRDGLLADFGTDAQHTWLARDTDRGLPPIKTLTGREVTIVSADLQIILRVIASGVGATMVLDRWAASFNRFFHIASPNWATVGRWLGHLSRGQLVHKKIADGSPVRGELRIGWSAHYAIGVLFATLFVVICGLDWLQQPRILPALIFGVAASNTPRPNVASVRSLATHTIFGLGLYAAAVVSAAMFRQ